MITINNKEYRNIVEQVQHNKELIEQHYARDRVLAEVGIKVMGQKDDESALVDFVPPGGEEAWGEAYLVGATEPYDIHIWTRPGMWFNIGPLNIIGEQGVPGDSIENAQVTSDNRLKITMDDGREITTNAFNTIKGDTGSPGPANSITAATVNPDYTVTFTFEDGSSATTNKSLRGQPGADSQIPGEKGDKGDSGRSIYIKGIVPSIEELRGINPLDDLFGAYLVGSTSPYLLYVPVQDVAQFVYAGQFMGGTVITVGGEAQDTFNADTKLNKITNGMSNISSSYEYIYVSSKQRNLAPRRMDDRVMSSDEAKYQIVCRDRNGSGNVRVPETPTETYHAASKSYVDNKYHLYRHNINFIAQDSGDSYTCYFTLYNTQATSMNNGDLTTDAYIAVNGVVDMADGRQYPIIYGTVNPGISYVTLNYYDPEEKQIVGVSLDAANFITYDTISRII